jgi:RimJ/RimL family protein N-acetyltransferase
LDVDIRPWSHDDLDLLEQLMGTVAMTEHLGGPESPEKIRERHERYCRVGESGTGAMFVIVAGPERIAVGSIGFWEQEWQGRRVWETGWSVLPEFQRRGRVMRSNDWRLDLFARLSDARRARGTIACRWA